MKLNHLNLTVTDVPMASEFLVKYFGMRSMGGNKGMDVLTDAAEGWGFILTLMKSNPRVELKYPQNFHIGFFVESRTTVDALYQRLKDDGIAAPKPEDTGHSYGFYIEAPGGFTVEVGA